MSRIILPWAVGLLFGNLIYAVIAFSSGRTFYEWLMVVITSWVIMYFVPVGLLGIIEKIRKNRG